MTTQTKDVTTHDLSAPEVLLLLNPKADGREALKVGMKELLAMGKLRLEMTRKPGFMGRETAQTRLRLESTERPRNLVLYGLMGDLRSAARHSDELPRLLQQLQREHGYGYAQFRRKVVLPALERRGLLELHTRRVLGLFSATEHRHTPAGLELKKRLEHDMAEARQIARRIKDDPAQVAALMLSLGAAAILVPELWPHFAQINELMRQHEGDAGGAWVYGSDTGSDRDPDTDLGSLDAGFADFDSSFDGSDGGGDGGGGGE